MEVQGVHILFYDPEENILAGLKRALYGMRRQWQMEFISNNEQAEQLLLQRKPDVLIADVSRSDKRGLQLLQKAQQAVPGTIRIGISAETDETTSLQAIRPTHRFLAKPFDMDELKAIILRALFLRDRINNSHVKDFVAQVEKLPTVPALFQQINQTLQREDASINEIASLIENDINITTQLLKIVNSAYFGLFKNISSIQQAVSLLGLELIKGLILGINLFKGVNCPPAARPLLEEIWQHSLTVARILQHIVLRERHDAQLASTAFSLGILHDAGKLIFLQVLKEEYVQLCAEADKTARPIWQIEKERYRLTHADAGAYLLGLWGLPDVLVSAVAESHENESTQSGSDYLSKILRTADALELGREVPQPQDRRGIETVQNRIQIAEELLKDSNNEQ